MPDWTAEVLAPLYAEFGVPASLVLDTGTYDDLTAIDETAGAALPGPVEVESVRPAACLMVRDLADRGIDPGQLDDGTITLNGKTWTIIAHQMRPSTNGEADGEVALKLEGAEG